MLSKARFRSVLIAVLAVLLVLAPAALAGKQSRYPRSLTATPNVLHAGDVFTVSGCGYDTSMGNVIVGFAGGSWGSALDSNGCFEIPHIPALAGDTLEYEGARVAHVPAYDGERGNLASELRAKMDSLTGAEPDFWLERVWGMRDSHKSAEWHEMRELDAQLLRYAE